ncbi:DUF2911 domain-containing protein [Aquimarina sp. RZ0]|uniref:DUF2911 domain-containing protein n=1 Tax=Aquimarina sp. RZ0 TaxID=2607730 RepID=UPI0011F3B63E|nr:DUF2911 domain-containing protein [Aquimarina sp. RZ0]KAA1241436.1 DUF2911 domain-containing protein [Aquimarina sp. RZ0]
MKKNILVLYILFVSISIQAQLRVPSLSPLATVQQNIGLTAVEATYSRPSKRGRTIFGKNGLLPYGELWRTGANAATKITFSDKVTIGGQSLEKGSYTIVSIPREKEWQIHWYSYQSSNWNTYAKKQPIITLRLPVQHLVSTVETFEIQFRQTTLDSAVFTLIWENTMLQTPIVVDVTDKVLKDIEKTLSGPTNTEYFQAALYLHESNTDLEKALEYIQKVTASDTALFFQVTREAMILKDLGNKKKAMIVARRALTLSEKANSKDFIRINKKLIKELDS